MYRNSKKGFTVVELVIVIAIIAILAAVLIPTFAALIQKANVSKDTQLVKNLNTALAIDGKNHPTMQSALDAASEAGFDIQKINRNAQMDNEIIWDSVNDVFCYLVNKSTVDKNNIQYIPDQQVKTPVENVPLYKYWRITDDATLAQNGPCSVYYIGTETTITTKVGFDAGTKKDITSVKYVGVGSEQDVVIRTNGGSLTVDAATDDVKHYGWCANLKVTAVRNNHCYHEFGFIGTFEYFGTGKFVAESGSGFHQAREEIDNVLRGKNFDLDNGEKYDVHYYVEGKCVTCNIDECQHVWSYSDNGDSGHTKTCEKCGLSANEEHTYTDGECVCGHTTVVAPTVLHLTGVVTYAAEADHSYDDGTTIGTMSNGYSDIGYYFSHMFTVTYTIPEGTPANTVIICDPVDSFVSTLQMNMMPGIALGFTYKIVDNSGNNFTIDNCTFTSEVAEAIKSSDSIIQMNDAEKWIVLKDDATYYELDEGYIPYITESGYFKQYVQWLNSNGKTTYTSVSNDFLSEYYSTHSKNNGDRFIDYLNGLVAAGSVTMDEIMDSLCGMPDYSNSATDQRHCEGEVIRLMLDYSYRKALGFTFVQNTQNGWNNGAYQKINKCMEAMDYGVGFIDWSTLAPTDLPVSNVYEVIEDGATLNYAKTGNVTTGGIALLWHAYAGNAWQGTTMCEPPYFTITLKSGN